MTRRRLAGVALAVLTAGGLLLIPAAGGAAPKDKPAASSSNGNGPKGDRCDPQPDHGNGPPDGKGKKCASP